MNLVTGATGLLGSHIVEKLIAQGQPVRVLVRSSSDTRVLDEWGVDKAIGDITDPESLKEAMKGISTNSRRITRPNSSAAPAGSMASPSV